MRINKEEFVERYLKTSNEVLAAELGISKSALYNIAKKLGVKKTAGRKALGSVEII